MQTMKKIKKENKWIIKTSKNYILENAAKNYKWKMNI